MLLKLDLQRFAPVPDITPDIGTGDNPNKTTDTTETWLLNNTLADYDSMYYGTEPGWYGDSEGFSENINFICDSVQYYGINPFNTHRPPEITMGVKLVYNNSTWIDEKYRKITFATPPTGDLLTWLQANGVKQQPTYTFKHWKKSNVVVNRTLVGEKYYYFKPYTILGLYKITTTLTNCAGATSNATKIQENGGLTLTFTANSGYELPTGVSVTNVTSYNWNKATGVLAISKPTGDVAIEIVAVSALPQLATPTNIAVTDTILTFDEVANATSYEVFVDNVSIGTHTIPSGHTISWSGGGKTPSISVSINDGEWVKLAEATGSINNVKTIKFLAEFNEFMVATVKSTTLNLNFSGDGKPSSITAGSIISSEYTLTQDVTDLIISTAPRSTTI